MTGTASKSDEALDVVNGVERIRFPRWAQNALGAVVGAALIGFPALWINDRDNFNAITNIVESHSRQLKEIKQFHKWPRFTNEDAKEKLIPINKDVKNAAEDINELKERHNRLDTDYRALLRQVYEVKAQLEATPPATWQVNRIVEIERKLAEIAVKAKKRGE